MNIKDIDSLVAWWDFTDLTRMFTTSAGSVRVASDGDPIGRITDQIASIPATCPDSNRPTYRENSSPMGGSAEYSQVNEYMATGSSVFDNITGPLTIVLIANNASGSAGYLCDGAASDGRCGVYISSGGGTFTMYRGNTATSNKQRTGNIMVMSAKFEGSDSYFRRDGAADNALSDTPGTDTVSGITIGNRFDFSAPYNGFMQHVLVFDGALSFEDLSTVEGFFNQQTFVSSESDHKMQLGGDAAHCAGFDPIGRNFYRFGGDGGLALGKIQWVNVDTWVSGISNVDTLANGGGAAYYPPNHSFILYGGRASPPAWPATANVYEYDIATDTISLLTEAMPAPRSGVNCQYVDGLIYIFGGVTNPTPVTAHNNIWVHDPVAGTITDTTASLPSPNSNSGLALDTDQNLVYLVGGFTADQTDTNSIVTYNPASSFTNAVQVGTMPRALENQATAYVPAQKAIYAINGYDYATGYTDEIFKIDTTTNTSVTLEATGLRADDDAVGVYDPVNDRIYCGPYVYAEQTEDNNDADKREMYEFDPNTHSVLGRGYPSRSAAMVTWYDLSLEGTGTAMTVEVYESGTKVLTLPLAELGVGGTFAFNFKDRAAFDYSAVIKSDASIVAQSVLYSGSSIVGVVPTGDTALIKELQESNAAIEAQLEVAEVLQRLAASGATGTVDSADNGNGTYTLTFYDTDGTTQLSTATYVALTGDRVRTS